MKESLFMDKNQKSKIYVSCPGAVCAAGMNTEEIWQNIIKPDFCPMEKIRTAGGNEFYAARIDENRLDSVFDEYDIQKPRLAMKCIRIEAVALKQIEHIIETAKSRYGAARIGVCVGSCDNGSEFSVAGHRKYFADGSFDSDYTLEMQSADYPATFVSETYGIEGPCMAFATACSSSASALIRACELIRSGEADAVIAGGVDIASDTVLLGFNSLEAVSDEPANPFSVNRKGITLGDGAAFFVLSKDNLALDFPAVVLSGYGESADAHHMTAPEPEGEGAVRAMRAALDFAGLKPQDIDYLNLHGTGTELNDSMESKAVSKVFGTDVFCSSTKSVTGHTLGASSALEAAICWETIRNNAKFCMPLQDCQNGERTESDFVPVLPLQHWDRQNDGSLPALRIADKESVKSFSTDRIIHCMSNSFAFGGANASLIFSRDDTSPELPLSIETNQLKQLLPQKSRMFLISRVLSYDIEDCSLTAESDIKESNIFFEEKSGGVPSFCSVELMAQSVGALSSITRVANKNPDKSTFGVILSIASFESRVPFFAVGKSVQIRVKEVFTADKVSQYKCVIDCGEEKNIAEVKLTVMGSSI